MSVEFKSGDPHNFNLRVRVVENSNPLALFKPRSVFWEHLFLDQRNYFREILNSNSAINFNSILGHVKVETTNQYQSGTANFFNQSPAIPDAEWFLNLGRLIAFCSTFGIVDLHKDNVLTDGKNFQIIDIECLFWNLEIPSETLLIPKTTQEWDRSIFSVSQLNGLGRVQPMIVEHILKGLNGFFNSFNNQRQSVLDYFLANEVTMSKHPVRILLKPTQEYRLAIDSKNVDGDYIQEEIVQLLRGDIPYFFGYLNKAEIYYYIRPNEKAKVELSNEGVRSKLARAFQNPTALLSSERIDRVHKQSIVEISRRLLDLSMLPYHSEDTKILIEGNYLKIVSGKYALQTRV